MDFWGLLEHDKTKHAWGCERWAKLVAYHLLDVGWLGSWKLRMRLSTLCLSTPSFMIQLQTTRSFCFKSV